MAGNRIGEVSMKTMTVLAVLCACLAVAAYANPLTINSPGVVGTVEPGTQNASVANEVEWANYLLGMTKSSSITIDGNTPPDGDTENYATSATEYDGTLTGGIQIDSTDVSGYMYVMAKYDGQNAGYVLFYVPGLEVPNTIPQHAYSIWGTETQYALSHFTGFGSTSVPDGGMTLMLLGGALIGLEGLRRKFRV